MNKRNVIILSSILIMIMIIGVSYAFFTYSKIGNNSDQLITGQIYMHYNEGADAINLSGILPESDNVARSRSDNYITFTIDGKNTSNNDINYEIKLIYGSDVEGKTRLLDKHLKFDLIEIIGGVSNNVLSGIKYNDLNNQRIWVNTISKNTTSEIEITYQLRMWISDSVWISDTDLGADYTTQEYANSFASIKVMVYGDFEEKKLATTADTIIDKVGFDGIVGLNSTGTLASDGEEIVAYRYSGSSRTCNYTYNNITYTINTEEELCPEACFFNNLEGEAYDHLILPIKDVVDRVISVLNLVATIYIIMVA